MVITGIICEYNPLHLGHQKQLLSTRQNPDDGVVCLMSGNYVQRGKPAIIDKSLRAKAAVLSGADLVLELPVTASLSSAEGFAAEGVRILNPFCTQLSFGAETADKATLLNLANALTQPKFSQALKEQLNSGLSFPAARQAALEALGYDASILALPNNILAVEYCKAILSQSSNMEPAPIFRGGDYHTEQADKENPSATAVRRLMLEDGNWLDYIPSAARDCFGNANLHTLEQGESAVLSRLRTMRDKEFEALPYGSEGLWRKLMYACRKENTLDAILTSVKSKRYTRTRLDRMVMCAFLGITREILLSPAPYVRVLAFNDKGRSILKLARQSGLFVNTGEPQDSAYQELENRCGALYGLFSQSGAEPPDAEQNRRVYYHH